MVVLTKGDQTLQPAEPTAKAAGRRGTTFNRREAIAGYLYITPWIIGFLIFTLGARI